MLFRRKDRAWKHTAVLVLRPPVLGWTVLRAAHAAARKETMPVSRQDGYQLIEYFSDHAIQVSGVDGSAIRTYETYRLVQLTVIESNMYPKTLSRAPGAYQEELAKYKGRLELAIERMCEIDSPPQVFERSLCRKCRKYAETEVMQTADGMPWCQTHGVLSKRHIRGSMVYPFENIPEL